MDIDGWLRRIGLEQYAQTFRDNAIDADVLRDLTDEHLRELGLPLGARLKILRAVAALGTNEQPLASSEITQAAPRTDAERRQLTVMFCDLVGSTALSARLDPEDMREIVGAYHRSCADLITKAGGFVAQRTGIINQIRAFLLERGVAVRQRLRFLRTELPRILAAPPDVLSPRMVRIIEDLAGDWRRLDERIDGLSGEIQAIARTPR